MPRRFLWCLLIASVASCTGDEADDDPIKERDAGRAVRDAGVVRDGGARVRDAGEEPRDGGEDPRDGGEDLRDAGEDPRDGGDVPRDGGVIPRDGGTRDGGPRDAGFECGNGVIEPGEQCDSEVCCAADCSGPAPLDTPCRAAAFDCDAVEVCDGNNLDCPVDDVLADGAMCNDCTAGAGACDTCLDGACADLRYFCADILATTPTAADGLYTINPALTPTTGTNLATVFCDMANGGWTMVHKKSRTMPGDASDLWTNGATNAADITLMDRAIATRNYRAAFLDPAWASFTQARVEVVTGTVVAKFIEFDTVGSTPNDWFASDRHTASNWTDLPTDPNWQNNSGRFFTIFGGARDWYINLQWGGCPADRGWLMITRGNFCYWEGNSGDPVEIIYSVLPTHGGAPTAQTGYADSLIVFVR